MRRNKNYRKRLGFERLERRQLLAGDFATGIIAAADALVDDQGPAQVAEVSTLEVEEVDQALEAALGNELESEPANANDLTSQTGLEDSSMENDTPDPRSLDLSDSMDGFFGAITPESPTETISFSAPADGMANIVVANSFEDSDLVLTATSANGSEIEFEMLSNDAFDSISFEVTQGETYELTVSSTHSESNGQFQLTVGFEEFVDQHADQAGSESTQLTWVDNQTELTGKLEVAGDVDTFRATSPAAGEVTLELNELEPDTRLNLDVTVTDSNGSLVAEGSTNEMLRITFDVYDSEEFFVSISAGADQKGDYQFSMSFEPSASNQVQETVAVVDETEEVESIAGDFAEQAEHIADVVDQIDEAVGEDVAEIVDEVSELIDANGEDIAAIVEDAVDAIEDELGGEPLNEIEEAVDDVLDQIHEVLEVESETEIEDRDIVQATEETVVDSSTEDQLAATIPDDTVAVNLPEGQIAEIADSDDSTVDEPVAEIEITTPEESVAQVDEDQTDQDPLDEPTDAPTAEVDVVAETTTDEAVIGAADPALDDCPIPVDQPTGDPATEASDSTVAAAGPTSGAGAGTVAEVAGNQTDSETGSAQDVGLPAAEDGNTEIVDIVVPVDGVVETPPVADAPEVAPIDAGEDQLVIDSTDAAVEDDTEETEFVCSFGPDSVDVFFASLSSAHDAFHDQVDVDFGDWARGFFRGLGHG